MPTPENTRPFDVIDTTLRNGLQNPETPEHGKFSLSIPERLEIFTAFFDNSPEGLFTHFIKFLFFFNLRSNPYYPYYPVFWNSLTEFVEEESFNNLSNC